jgi:hypothetical protein
MSIPTLVSSKMAGGMTSASEFAMWFTLIMPNYFI